MSAKCPLAEAERFELSEPFVRLAPLAEGWFRPLTHDSFLLTLQSYKAQMQPICVSQNNLFFQNLWMYLPYIMGHFMECARDIFAHSQISFINK